MARTRVRVEGGVSTPAFDATAALAGVVNREVVETSQALTNVLIDADKEATTTNARQIVFENANAATEKAIDARFPQVVERVFAPKDWGAVLDRYDAWLELGEKRTDEAFIRKAHESGPRIIQDLFDVYAQVRLARESWELENDVTFGAMREQASKALEFEKERKIRTKMITEKDIDSKCASMFPDEWAAQESKRLRMKLTEDRMKFAVENAQTRSRVLDAMMARLR